MSVYRYATTEIRSGVIKGDWLPLVPMNFARNINATGTFTGALNLTAGNTPAERANNILAVEPEKSVLWCFQDTVPVWCGIIWDWPHMSVLDNTLPLTCSTMESLFQKRLITDDLTFTNADIFDVFRGLAAYALGKNPAAAVAGFTMGSNESGITTTISYTGSDMKAVYDAWTDLITAYAFEYSIRPTLDSAGNPVMVLDLGMPQLGLPLTTANLAFSLPGNLLDYRFARTGSTSSNMVYASASGSGTLTALNATPTFGSGIGGWTGLNGAAGTLTTSTVWADSGNTQSLQFNGDGSTADPLAQTESVTVEPDTAYTWQADLYSAAGWSATELQVVWYDGTGTEISTVFSAVFDVSAGTALTGSSMSVTSPDGAATAAGGVVMIGTPPSSVQMLVDTAIFGTIAAAAPVAAAPAGLNATPTFGSGIGGWTGLNGAEWTLTTSTVWADTGDTQSLQFNGDGYTAIPLAQTESITVQPDTAYTWSADLYSTAGWADTELQVVWYDDTGTEINSIFSGALDVTAGTALTGSSMSVTSPDGAATAVARVDMMGTPPETVQMLVDTAVFTTAAASTATAAPVTASQDNWESALPHGQDPVVLAAGYPLLEESVSLTTVTVTEQAQIDGYADGVLASVTGTQLAPLLILGNDQGPAAKDIVLGSYCYFNSTSPLHPAGPGGQWGLQITGRITGWQLYPPTSAQAEVTWLQLGEINDIEGRTYIPSGAAV